MRANDITALVPRKAAAPTPQRMATHGIVAIPPASVTDDTITVTLRFSADYGFRCRWVRQGNTLPATGAECLVLWDETGAGTVVQWAGAGVALPTLADTAALAARLSALEAPATPTAVASFAHSWANLDADRPARFYKAAGRVYVEGIIAGGTVGQSAFTLPAGYRHDRAMPLTFPVVSNNAFGAAYVYSDGTVTPAVGSNVFFDLSAVDFLHA